MAEAEIPVDLDNPGQVFACFGLMEAADTLLGEVTAGFSWDAGNLTARFHLQAAGDENPVQHVLRFLSDAEVATEAPAGSNNTTAKWKIGTEELPPYAPFPFPDPSSPATLPAVLRDRAGREIRLDHWGDARPSENAKVLVAGRDNVKFWAGSGGYPGAALLRDALDLVREVAVQHVQDPCALSCPQSSSFRFDWRRDYVPLDAGFSPNAHGGVQMTGFPLVEILAAVGLTYARPMRPDVRDKLRYDYAVLGGGVLLDPVFPRAVLGASDAPVPGLPFRRFAMHLGWPGQEGQARCITNVFEITDRETAT